MRHLHAVWSLDDRVGGLMRAVVAIAGLQAAAGHEVTIVSTTAESDTHAALADLPPEVTVHLFPRSRTTRRYAGSAALRTWVRDRVSEFDSVHVHSIWDLPSYTTARTAIRAGTPLVVSPHGSLDPYDVRKHARVKQLLGPLFVRSVLESATTVLCTTHREARDLVTYGGSPSTAVAPIPLSVVDSPVCDREEFRRRWGIESTTPLLLFLSRLDAKKGLEHLLGALARMTVPAHLLMVGAGDPAFEAELERRIAELGLTDRIIRTGWLSGGEKAAAFAASDLFVLLSDFENYGIAVVEALQHGLPSVTSTEVYVGQDLAEDGAVLLSDREPESAARTLDRVLGNPDELALLRHHGEEALRTRLSPDSLTAQYESLTRSRMESST